MFNLWHMVYGFLKWCQMITKITTKLHVVNLGYQAARIAHIWSEINVIFQYYKLCIATRSHMQCLGADLDAKYFKYMDNLTYSGQYIVQSKLGYPYTFVRVLRYVIHIVQLIYLGTVADGIYAHSLNRLSGHSQALAVIAFFTWHFVSYRTVFLLQNFFVQLDAGNTTIIENA